MVPSPPGWHMSHCCLLLFLLQIPFPDLHHKSFFGDPPPGQGGSGRKLSDDPGYYKTAPGRANHNVFHDAAWSTKLVTPLTLSGPGPREPMFFTAISRSHFLDPLQPGSRFLAGLPLGSGLEVFLVTPTALWGFGAPKPCCARWFRVQEASRGGLSEGSWEASGRPPGLEVLMFDIWCPVSDIRYPIPILNLKSNPNPNPIPNPNLIQNPNLNPNVRSRIRFFIPIRNSIPNPISDIRYPNPNPNLMPNSISNPNPNPISDTCDPIIDFWYLNCETWILKYDVRYPMSDICVSEIWVLRSAIIGSRPYDIRCVISDIWDPISDMWYLISSVWNLMFEYLVSKISWILRSEISEIIWCLTSDIWKPISEYPIPDIRGLTSDIWIAKAGIPHPTSGIRDLTSDIRYPRSDLWDPIIGICYLNCETLNLKSDVRYPMFDFWVSEIWVLRFEIWSHLISVTWYIRYVRSDIRFPISDK